MKAIRNPLIGVPVEWVYRRVLRPRGWHRGWQVCETGPGARGCRPSSETWRVWYLSPPLRAACLELGSGSPSRA